MTSPFVFLLPAIGVFSILFCWGAGLGMTAIRVPARRSSRRDPRQ